MRAISPPDVKPEPAGRPEDLALLASEALRELIATGALSAGEQIRQADLSAHIGVSRSPLREALRGLEQEGLLHHEPRRGYFVARLNREELEQIYRMRLLLERELLDTARPADEATLVALREANELIAAATRSGSLVEVLRSNTAFHRAIFDLSPLTFIRQEVSRLWRLSEPYQAAYLRHPMTPGRIVHEHEEIIAAVAAADHDQLVALIDAHRASARSNVLRMLPPEPPGREIGDRAV